MPNDIAIVHEPDHPEPWIVAMSERPSAYRAFGYGLGWGGIAVMSSDLESRGFGLEASRTRRSGRSARLLLVMALAPHRAMSTGMRDAAVHPVPAKKNLSEPARRRSPAA